MGLPINIMYTKLKVVSDMTMKQSISKEVQNVHQSNIKVPAD